MVNNCVRDAHYNSATILRPDALIKQLKDAGMFDDDAILGRVKFGAITRTALNVEMNYLLQYEEEIKDFIEDNTKHHADDAYAVLCFGVILAGMQGIVKFESPVLADLQAIVSKLPPAMVQRLMTSRHNIRQLLK